MDDGITTHAESMADFKKVASHALGVPHDNNLSVTELQERFAALHPPLQSPYGSQPPSIRSITDQVAEVKKIASELLGIPDGNSLSLEEFQDELKFAAIDSAFSPPLGTSDEHTPHFKKLIARLEACREEIEAFQKRTQIAFAAVSLFWLSLHVSNRDTKEKVEAMKKRCCEVFDDYMWPGSHKLYLRGMCGENAENKPETVVEKDKIPEQSRDSGDTSSSTRL
ncbi:uncharacterized protein AB675_559 [Cyphellophora attinorum]|uniref:Uncharacterized protein n=1 Tax=Cyphellophora attinorum TaxID=1664694 RepID=A0A0N1P4I7_9EURO|nr:uncharacterized protein AB675_559 [Phialophora attinorum]KPI45844.1 hypothetical protein AB675_559 [Phialophora attinorum]